MPYFIPILSVGGLLLLIAGAISTYQKRQLTLSRLHLSDLPPEPPAPVAETSLLNRWLFLAGYRGSGNANAFVAVSLLTAIVGLGTAFSISASGLLRLVANGLAIVPGGLGNLFLPFIHLGPWIPAAGLIALPTLVVRARRRAIVLQVEQDLPIVLELLATLSEIGLGFDAALDRILGAQPVDRPLTREFRAFQRDLLGGRGRVDSLRKLASRLDVTTFTVFISAVVQAEQAGAGVAGVMRRQAESLRERRRERALELAMGLPVKLLFPMVICFLPGIFVTFIGPTFHEFFQYVESISRSRGL